jgi:spermidine synthase
VIISLREPTARRILAALFITTGATALIAEQAYEKLLETLVGTSTPAAATVLTIYFAGLTIGGFSWRWWRRLRAKPLVLYAIFEAAIGLWAILLYAGLEHLIVVFLPLLRLGTTNPLLMQTVRAGVACSWILPPTIFMGATFPAIVDVLRDNLGGARRQVTQFYALNIFGGVLAASLGPYAIFATIGVDGALLVTAIDIVVAAVAFWLSRRLPPPSPDAESATEVSPGRSGRGTLLIVISVICGFLFFALEIEWTHLINAVCGNSVYAFASMLAAVLAGLFLGGGIATRLLPRETEVPVAVPAMAFAAGAAILAMQQAVWPHVPHLFTLWGGHLQSFAAAELLRAFVTALVIVPPAAVVGTVFPLLFRLREFPLQNRGRTAGAMTAANAIGCCAGALAAAFVLIPRFGSETTLLLIALSYAVAGAALLLLAPASRLRVVGFAVAALSLLACGLVPPWDRLRLTSGEHVYFAERFSPARTRLLFFHEDAAGGITTVIYDPAANARTLLTNGKFQGNDAGEPAAQIGFALVPILHSGLLSDALVVGLGTGQTAGITQMAGFQQVDIAEIAPGILDAASHEFLPLNHGVIRQPNVRVFIEDGRNVLLLRDKKYDVITIELNSCWFAGATNLYSREFYEIAARRLRPGGMLQQWVQLHHTGPREIASTILTMRAAFRYVSLWIAGEQGIMLGSNEPQVIRGPGVRGAMQAIARSGIRREALCTLTKGRLLSPQDVDRLALSATTAVINTDRNRWIEYDTPRFNIGRDLRPINMMLLQRFAKPAPQFITPDAMAQLDGVCGSPKR